MASSLLYYLPEERMRQMLLLCSLITSISFAESAASHSGGESAAARAEKLLSKPSPFAATDVCAPLRPSLNARPAKPAPFEAPAIPEPVPSKKEEKAKPSESVTEERSASTPVNTTSEFSRTIGDEEIKEVVDVPKPKISAEFHDEDFDTDFKLLAGPRTWDEAQAACHSLGEGWDLPKRADLGRAAIQIRSSEEKVFERFRNIRSMAWTSDEAPQNGAKAWAVYMSTGNMATVQKASVLPTFCAKVNKEESKKK